MRVTFGCDKFVFHGLLLFSCPAPPTSLLWIDPFVEHTVAEVILIGNNLERLRLSSEIIGDLGLVIIILLISIFIIVRVVER